MECLNLNIGYDIPISSPCLHLFKVFVFHYTVAILKHNQFKLACAPVKIRASLEIQSRLTAKPRENQT